jgi:hypothetical protein
MVHFHRMRNEKEAKLSRCLSGAVAAVVLALAICGCGHRAQPAAKAKPAQATQTLLPEWAPKSPSPEFLRAARVLKALPLSTVRFPGATEAQNAAEARAGTIEWPAAYEFFGTLTDTQMQRFLTSEPDWKEAIATRRSEAEPRKGWKRVLIPMKSLTPPQRRAFDKWAAAWGRGREATHPDSADYLVLLYKAGATKDLSNVRIGFKANPHYVGVISCITKPDGTMDGICSDFALY